MLLAIQLMAASQLPGCRSYSSVIGKDSIKPLIVEDHSLALPHWAEKGIRNAVLINIDTHDDIRWVQDKNIDALRDIYRRKDWKLFRESGSLSDNTLYHIGNWIYAGGHLGIFSEVYWVIPFDVLSMENPDLQMRRFLRDYEFNEQEIQTFSLHGRQFRGSFHGIPLTVCDIKSLPDISDPVLLSMDTDYFPPYSTVNEKSYLSALHEVFQALYAKKYKVLDAVVCYSVNSNYLPPYLRWVGDTIAAILEKPGMINKEPLEQLTLLQQIDNSYRGTDATEMLKLISSWMVKYPLPSLQLYKAYAHVLQGESDHAYQAAVESCKTDRLYCTGLPNIGSYYYSEGRYKTAEKFFVAGYAANPGMSNDLFFYGHCLRKLGRLNDALISYEKDEAINGTFPTRFLIAEIQLLQNDKKTAEISIAKAVKHLMTSRYAQVVNHETAGAIYTVLDYCDRVGLNDLARNLRNCPAVTSMFAQYPRK
ncbi:MAG: hypothetical protein GJV46_10560 [Geobacter sp.]|nr:hypothetical protein [Geobacter sp.]